MSNINKLVQEAINVPLSIGATTAGMVGSGVADSINTSGHTDKKHKEKISTVSRIGSIVGGMSGAYGVPSIFNLDDDEYEKAIIASSGIGSFAGGLAAGSIYKMLHNKKRSSK